MKHIKTINELAINESKFNKKKLMKAIKKDDGMISTGDGKEYLVYNPKNGYAGAEDMWQDDVVFALDQDGGEHEIKYSDIVRFDESIVTEGQDTIGGLNKMANTDLERISDYADMIKDRMSQGQTLDAWMYSKISDSVKNLNSVHDTMDGNDGVDEGTLIDLRLVNENVEDEIELALTNWLNTLADGNAVKMTDLYLENGVLLGTVAKEIKQGRLAIQEYFEMFLKKSPIGSVDSFILQNFGDVCISDGTYTFEIDGEGGNRESVAARYTYVWKKENKKWMIATHHSSINP